MTESMTPIEQAQALLKAAEEASLEPWEVDGFHLSAVIRKVSGDKPGKWERIADCTSANWKADAQFIRVARRFAPAIASALLEKQKALDEAKSHIQIMLDIFEPIAGSETSLEDKRLIREARDFLTRQGV